MTTPPPDLSISFPFFFSLLSSCLLVDLFLQKNGICAHTPVFFLLRKERRGVYMSSRMEPSNFLLLNMSVPGKNKRNRRTQVSRRGRILSQQRWDEKKEAGLFELIKRQEEKKRERETANTNGDSCYRLSFFLFFLFFSSSLKTKKGRPDLAPVFFCCVRAHATSM